MELVARYVYVELLAPRKQAKVDDYPLFHEFRVFDELGRFRRSPDQKRLPGSRPYAVTRGNS